MLAKRSRARTFLCPSTWMRSEMRDNLPPGVTPSMLPGNSKEDEMWEDAREWVAVNHPSAKAEEFERLAMDKFDALREERDYEAERYGEMLAEQRREEESW